MQIPKVSAGRDKYWLHINAKESRWQWPPSCFFLVAADVWIRCSKQKTLVDRCRWGQFKRLTANDRDRQFAIGPHEPPRYPDSTETRVFMDYKKYALEQFSEVHPSGSSAFWATRFSSPSGAVGQLSSKVADSYAAKQLTSKGQNILMSRFPERVCHIPLRTQVLRRA